MIAREQRRRGGRVRRGRHPPGPSPPPSTEPAEHDLMNKLRWPRQCTRRMWPSACTRTAAPPSMLSSRGQISMGSTAHCSHGMDKAGGGLWRCETGLRLRPSNLIAFHNSWAVLTTPAIQEVLFTRIDWNSRARLGATCRLAIVRATHNAHPGSSHMHAKEHASSPHRGNRQCPLVQELVLHEPEAAIVLSACECLGTRLRVLRLEGLAKATNSLFAGIALNNSTFSCSNGRAGR